MLTYQEIIKTSPLKLQGEPAMLATYIPVPRRDEYLRLLKYLEDRTDYFISPASRNHHQAYEGGLLKHSLEVTALTLALNDTLKAGITMDSLIFCGMCHDLGKVNSYMRNTVKGKMAYRMNPKRGYGTKLPVPVLSLIHASGAGLTLTEAEQWAILYHDGLYVPENRDALMHGNETPLYLILHTADMWSGREFGELCLKLSGATKSTTAPALRETA